MTFPPGFLWGASTAAHQIEGGNVNSRLVAARVGAPAAARRSSRRPATRPTATTATPKTWRCSPTPGWTPTGSASSGRGSSPRRAGSRAPRSTTTGAWSRPRATSGLQPMVTLHHFTNPVWFARDGRVALGCRGRALRPVRGSRAAGARRRRAGLHDQRAEHGLGARRSRGRASRRPGCRPGVPEVTATLVDAHRRAVEIVRGAGKQAGWSVATQAYQAVPGAEEVAAEYGASREDVFLDAARGDDWVGRPGVHAHAHRRGRPAADRRRTPSARSPAGSTTPPPSARASATRGHGRALRSTSPRTASPPPTTAAASTTRAARSRPCARASTTASTCADICTGARSTTTSGAATGRRSGSSAGTARPSSGIRSPASRGSARSRAQTHSPAA